MSIDGVKFGKLMPEEQAIVEWQYEMHGDFKQALFEAICRADTHNLDLIALGFPVEVMGYRLYAYEDGWWPAVQDKIKREAANDEA